MSRFSACIGQHWEIWLLCFIAFCLYIVPAFNIQAFILSNQDFNPVYFGKLFLGEAGLTLGDAEVGENARWLSLSNLYYLIPLVLYKIGIPLESMSFVHTLFGLSLFWAAYYALALGLFQDKKTALFSTVFFTATHFVLFLPNMGYDISFLDRYYYGDFNHIIAVASLAALVWKRYALAGLFCASLILCNAIYGVNLAIFLGLYTLVSKQLFKPFMILPVIIISASLAGAYILLQLATPIYAPAPHDAREIAIQTYGHLAVHTHHALQYIVGLVYMIAGLGYAFFAAQSKSHIRDIVTSFIAFYLVVSIGLYWVLYIFAPEVFVMLSPARSLMLLCLFISVFVSHAFYKMILDHSLFMTLLGSALFAILVWKASSGGGLIIYWGGAVICMVAHFIILHVKHIKLPEWKTENFKNTLQVMVLIGMTGWIAWSMPWIKQPQKFFTPLESLLDVSKKIKTGIEAPALFVVHQEGSYSSMIKNSPALRTYSGKNMVVNSFGRNVYFDSEIRHDWEDRNYIAADMELWEPLILEAQSMKENAPLYYYTGIKFQGGHLQLSKAGISTITSHYLQTFRQRLTSYSLEQKIQFAKKLGATHIFVIHDSSWNAPYQAKFGNDFFSVLELQY